MHNDALASSRQCLQEDCFVILISQYQVTLIEQRIDNRLSPIRSVPSRHLRATIGLSGRRDLDAGQLPDLNRLRAHFAPDPAQLPNVVVQLTPLASYECLIGAAKIGGAA